MAARSLVPLVVAGPLLDLDLELGFFDQKLLIYGSGFGNHVARFDLGLDGWWLMMGAGGGMELELLASFPMSLRWEIEVGCRPDVAAY
ncbi:hypothetical protein ACLOJK_036921 [Asimina triloba]